ncbi:MAG: UDP-N-acetylmuramoyl-tripeptide--D-alanyl-D-alanine ligase [Minisyncoccia bacterium]
MEQKIKNIVFKIFAFLAKLTVKKYKPFVIGVTGVVGKTSTKLAIYQVLSAKYNVRASPKSFNNEIGISLAILSKYDESNGLFFWLKLFGKSIVQLLIKFKSFPKFLVLEYGVDRPKDMDKLLPIVKPNISVFTALSDIPSHIEFFPTVESLAREKFKLLNTLSPTQFAIINGDDHLILNFKNQIRANVLTYGFHKNNNIQIINFENFINLNKKEYYSTFKLKYKNYLVPFKTKALGKSQAYNVAAAAAVGVIMGLNLVDISETMNNYETFSGRFKILEGINDSILIDDTYNSSPLSLEESLNIFNDIQAKRKIVVLGDMLELGQYTFKAHQKIAKKIVSDNQVTMLITVGLRAQIITSQATKYGFNPKHNFHFTTLEEVIEFLKDNIQKGDVILFKASQGVRLEKVLKIFLKNKEDYILLPRQNKKWLSTTGLYDNIKL